jgi:hypothetical protein
VNEGDRPSRREAGLTRDRARFRRRRALAALAAVVLLLGLGALALGASGGDDGQGDGSQQASGSDGEGEKPPPPKPPELPRGGRRILPDNRVVAFYGAPQADELGILGIGPPSKVGAKLNRQARPYRAGGKPVLPAFELLGSIAQAGAGDDGQYTALQEKPTIRRYLRAARKAKALLLLDLQPGRTDFLTQARQLEEFLREPDVSLALDPEWSMDEGEIPGQVIGSTTAAKINQVQRYLSRLSRERNLPEKLLLIHQFTPDMIENKEKLRRVPGVSVVLNVDGFGDQKLKRDKYRAFTREGRFNYGFKVFYKEDTKPMSPRQVLALRPQPDVVEYE